jgi:hypothetical protein
MKLNKTPDRDQRRDDADLDDETTEGHRQGPLVGEPEPAVNRDIDEQSSRPK